MECIQADVDRLRTGWEMWPCSSYIIPNLGSSHVNRTINTYAVSLTPIRSSTLQNKSSWMWLLAIPWPGSMRTDISLVLFFKALQQLSAQMKYCTYTRMVLPAKGFIFHPIQSQYLHSSATNNSVWTRPDLIFLCCSSPTLTVLVSPSAWNCTVNGEAADQWANLSVNLLFPNSMSLFSTATCLIGSVCCFPLS